MKRVLVPLADGFEEVEALTAVDMLRRAEIEVATAALRGGTATGSHRITVVCDISLDEAMQQEWDLVFLPGGMPGAQHLRDDARVTRLIQKAAEQAHVAAICAAPMALAAAGLLTGKRATSYPGFLDAFSEVLQQEIPLVQDGNISTARGPGVALDFALHLVEVLAGKETRDRVEGGLQRPS